MRIGVTTRIDKFEPYGEIRVGVDINWFKIFEGFAQEVFPVQTFQQGSIESIKRADLVVLTGGNDLSAHSNCQFSLRRDAIETEIVEYCIRQQKKLVGVCRGMQFLNQYFGGKLAAVSDHVAQDHPVDVFEEWVPKTDEVNSFHGWGIPVSTVAQKFCISATTNGGEFVEAFRHPSLPIRGVMWHPERYRPQRLSEENYFRLQRKIFEFE